jgi:hypothetical protein
MVVCCDFFCHPNPRSTFMPRTVGALLLLLTFAAAGNAMAGDLVDTYQRATDTSRRVGDAYFAAYIAKDWDRLAPMLAPDASFADPTAQQVFENSVAWVGKDVMLQKFRSAYAPLTMKFTPLRTVHSGTYALYEGTLDWTLNLPKRSIRSSMPFVSILRIEKGLVVEHRDIADYRPFIAAEIASRPAAPSR